MYKKPWGSEHSQFPTSKGFSSKAALARAVWEWAGPDWRHRVQYDFPDSTPPGMPPANFCSPNALPGDLRMLLR
eukprot:6106961-Heterocapsa_arctica.AAC.1